MYSTVPRVISNARHSRRSCHHQQPASCRMVEFITLVGGVVLVVAAQAARAGILYAGDGQSRVHRSDDKWGNYAFGYDESHSTGATFRREQGNAAGAKIGSYGLRDIDGRYRVVNYVADSKGFRASIVTNEPGTASSAPAAITYNRAGAGSAHYSVVGRQPRLTAPTYLIPAVPAYSAPVAPKYAPLLDQAAAVATAHTSSRTGKVGTIFTSFRPKTRASAPSYAATASRMATPANARPMNPTNRSAQSVKATAFAVEDSSVAPAYVHPSPNAPALIRLPSSERPSSPVSSAENTVSNAQYQTGVPELHPKPAASRNRYSPYANSGPVNSEAVSTVSETRSATTNALMITPSTSVEMPPITRHPVGFPAVSRPASASNGPISQVTIAAAQSMYLNSATHTPLARQFPFPMNSMSDALGSVVSTGAPGTRYADLPGTTSIPSFFAPPVYAAQVFHYRPQFVPFFSVQASLHVPSAFVEQPTIAHSNLTYPEDILKQMPSRKNATNDSVSSQESVVHADNSPLTSNTAVQSPARSSVSSMDSQDHTSSHSPGSSISVVATTKAPNNVNDEDIDVASPRNSPPFFAAAVDEESTEETTTSNTVGTTTSPSADVRATTQETPATPETTFTQAPLNTIVNTTQSAATEPTPNNYSDRSKIPPSITSITSPSMLTSLVSLHSARQPVPVRNVFDRRLPAVPQSIVAYSSHVVRAPSAFRHYPPIPADAHHDTYARVLSPAVNVDHYSIERDYLFFPRQTSHPVYRLAPQGRNV